MKSKENLSNLGNFKLRKIVHYSLIACILLIQIIIAGFFYNEFVNKKQLGFIEKQLVEIHALEKVTDESRGDLLEAQDYLQKYLMTEDNQYLEGYFKSVNRLAKNLDSITNFNKNETFTKVLKSNDHSSSEFKKLKALIDSTNQITTKPNVKKQAQASELRKYNFDNNILDKFDIQTKTFSDSVEKKGMFGRLRDAIAGTETVRKDSTVVTIKQGKSFDFSEMKFEIDSIINAINNHYSQEVSRIKFTLENNQRNTQSTSKNDKKKFYKTFSRLMIYSNDLMKVYEGAVRESKSNLEKELNQQNSKNNKIRQYLIIGLMILMFIVSILIMYFTRMAFVYERKLKIADQKNTENLKFKNRILGMLSHELRSPLKIIGIFINRINKKTTDETVKDYLKSISFTNNTLLMQANQILEYTKNQQVENKLIPVVFNLKNEITSILNSIEPYIETRNNKFVINENINPDLVVYSDNTKINQIFMNILGNANKFTENGQITVTTLSELIDEHTVSLTTTVSDTGAGISEADLEKIFEPYYQGIISNEVENLGAGLGLSLCKEIIELYSGEIAVISELTKGTTVIFSINLKINESPRI